ncbi:MAG: DUF2637 domain-containing protein [Actinophytocola sp.]|nr:DUF2637 domain-containing protein [Actinophytocola sp.]
MTTLNRHGVDVPMLAGLGVVALAAAVMSFASLQQLGERAGFPPVLAALLPLAIDAKAVVATRAWLSRRTPDRARRYACGLALAAVALSVAGNAGEHAMTAYALATPWWVVVTVSAIPPIALAATAHLAVLLAAGSIEAADSDTDQVDPIESATSTDQPITSVSVGTPVTEPKAPTEVDRPSDQQESTSTRVKDSHAGSGPARRSIEELRQELTAAIESDSVEIDATSAESIRKTLRCSPARARQLRDEYPRLHAIA